MPLVTLSNLRKVEVDAIDFIANGLFNWSDNGAGYAYRRFGKERVYLHLEIAREMGLNGPEVDHKDRNPYNCKRENLRESNRQLQNANHDLQKNNTTGYRGVCFDKNRRKYIVGIKFNQKLIHLGRFDSDIEAAKAYNSAALRLFGEHAVLNKVS